LKGWRGAVGTTSVVIVIILML